MTVYIYKYHPITFEYLGKEEAQADPEETKKAGRFIPLVPAYATLTAPRIYKQGFIPQWNGEDWNIVPDYRLTHYEIDKVFNVFPIDYIGELKHPENWLVTKDFGDRLKADRSRFKIVNNEIIEKTDEEIKQEKIEAKEKQFNELFFNTSLGYVKRTVTFKDGKTANFLTDIVPLLEIDTPIITYNKPDFESEELPSQNRDVKVTEAFLIECKMQLLQDFWGSEIK